MLPLVLIIVACVCFAIAAWGRTPEAPVRFGWLGLFFWSLSLFVERL